MTKVRQALTVWTSFWLNGIKLCTTSYSNDPSFKNLNMNCFGIWEIITSVYVKLLNYYINLLNINYNLFCSYKQ